MSEIIRRLNVEYAFEHDKIRVGFGTMNRKNPIPVYIEGKCFITPSFYSENYKKEVDSINYRLKRLVNEYISVSGLFEPDYILDLQIPHTCMDKDKKSYLFFQLTLKQKKKKPIEIGELYNKEKINLYNFLDSMCCMLNNKDFSVAKTKKSS